jgi:hypothetical protein
MASAQKPNNPQACTANESRRRPHLSQALVPEVVPATHRHREGMGLFRSPGRLPPPSRILRAHCSHSPPLRTALEQARVPAQTALTCVTPNSSPRRTTRTHGTSSSSRSTHRHRVHSRGALTRWGPRPSCWHPCSLPGKTRRSRRRGTRGRRAGQGPRLRWSTGSSQNPRCLCRCRRRRRRGTDCRAMCRSPHRPCRDGRRRPRIVAPPGPRTHTRSSRADLHGCVGVRDG